LKSISDFTRKEFVDLKRQFVHPSKEISQPDQLVGREKDLDLLRNCFERDGSHAFIWGPRGVGKTSLAHSACTKFSEIVVIGPAIACQPDSTVESLFGDIIRRALKLSPILGKDKGVRLKLGAYGIAVEGQVSGGFTGTLKIESVNHASELLDTLFPSDFEKHRKTAIIVDEFDTLKNADTIEFLTALAKQMSVDNVDVKIVFCGVASNFDKLVGSHESVARYLSAVKLNPLSDDAIWQVIEGISENFYVKLHRGQLIRIGQIACGYPSFAHLIMDEILNVAFENKLEETDVPQEIFNEGIRRAAAGAATNLQSAYEDATMRGTDRYVEVLWAAANGQHIDGKQFKDIKSDYDRLMVSRKGRDVLTGETAVRNHLNNLSGEARNRVLSKPRNGWYRFKDPMFRGYVRMVAHNDGIELGDESFPA